MDAFKKTFAGRVAEVRAELPPGTPVEVWFQDEMRVGQKNKLTYRWARKGSRPRAIHDQRTQSTYLFGAVCPERGTGAALVLLPATPKPCSFISMKLPRRSPLGSGLRCGGASQKRQRGQGAEGDSVLATKPNIGIPCDRYGA